MPSVSKSQEEFMKAAAANKAFAKRADIPQSVAKEFVEADKQAAKSASKMIKNRYKE